MKWNFSWVRARQTKYGAYLAIYILVVLALLALVNWAVNRHSKSWDLTANKQYSLSDQSLKILRGLEREVRVYYFGRSTDFSRARDLLGQYSRVSNRFSVEYIDPDRQPAKARAAGFKAGNTVVLTLAERRQEANLLDEESVTNALIRLLKGGAKNVCFLTGHGERDIEDSERAGYSRVKKSLEDSNYTVKTISLLREAQVPKDCSLVMVAGPKGEYTEPEVQALQKYVEGGGRALFLLEPGTPGKLEEMLAGWGVTLKEDLVADASPLSQIFGGDITLPVVSQYKSHAITRESAGMATILPVARSVQPVKESKSGVTVDTLFESSPESWTAPFSPRMTERDLFKGADKRGAVPLAVAATLSKGEGAEKKEGRFVVVGSSRFASNTFLGFNRGSNRDLFLNMVNWLSSDEDLISIRPKEPENRRVNLTVAQMRRVFYLSVVGLPLLMIASGIAVWWKRR